MTTDSQTPYRLSVTREADAQLAAGVRLKNPMRSGGVTI